MTDVSFLIAVEAFIAKGHIISLHADRISTALPLERLGKLSPTASIKAAVAL